MNKKRIYLFVVAIVILSFSLKWITSDVSGRQANLVVGLPLHLAAPLPYVEGQLSGVQVRVPANYMRGGRPFMVEYQDDHPWDVKESSERGKSRSVNSPIADLAFYVHLPDLEPLTQENYESWLSSFRDTNTSEWIEFSYQGSSRGLSSWGPNFLNRHVVNRGYRFSAEIQFQAQSTKIFGLTMEKTFPVDESKYDPNNFHFYSRRIDSVITTFIECQTGKTPSLNGKFSCEHYFSLWPDALVEGYIKYPPSRLKDWEDLEHQAKLMFHRFVIGCLPSTTACPIPKNKN